LDACSVAALGGLELQSPDRHGPPQPERAAGRIVGGELLMTAEPGGGWALGWAVRGYGMRRVRRVTRGGTEGVHERASVLSA